MKEVDLGEPTSFLDHVYLGCTQRECETSEDIVDNYRNMFESKISAGATEKQPCSGKLGADISSWSYDMEGHAKKCVERYCELENKITQQLFKVATPCIDDHQFKEEEMGSVGELSKDCSQFVLKCLQLARIGRLDVSWSVKKLPRAVTKWTRACDKRLARLLSDIHRTSGFKQYYYLGNKQHNNADRDCFRTLILPEIWKPQKSTSRDFCAYSEVIRSCQQVGCARKSHQFHTVQQELKLSLLMHRA